MNSEHSVPQKLFTIGHELGHFFRHRNSQNDFFDLIDEEKYFGTPHIEQEANLFSSELLVPGEVLLWMLDSGFSFYRMKMNLGISGACLKWRIVRFLKETNSLNNTRAVRVVDQFIDLSGRKLHGYSQLLTLRKLAATSEDDFGDADFFRV